MQTKSCVAAQPQLRWDALVTAAMLAVAVPAVAQDAQVRTLVKGEGVAQPSISTGQRGEFVVTWQQRTGDTAALHFAVLAADGHERRRGRIAAGQQWFVNWADFPPLVVLDNGDWVTHWLEKSATDPYAYDARIVRTTDGGRN
jgi:hypothetical protein